MESRDWWVVAACWWAAAGCLFWWIRTHLPASELRRDLINHA